jgi:hypothetical protein
MVTISVDEGYAFDILTIFQVKIANCIDPSKIAASQLGFNKLFDELYFKTISQWGGGYPRPQIEMMECRWRADSKKNPDPNPQSFIMMKPDINMADLLYEK